jgi:predicted RNase H-like nuclease
MAGGTPLPDKKSIGGQAHRLALLRERLPGVLDALRRVEAGRRHAEPADALDALACLQTALRVRSGSYEQLGGDPDATGLSMRIVF